MIQTIDFAPLDGITKIVFRQVWSQFFGGVDRYFIPFFSPTPHHLMTPRDLREVDYIHNANLPSVPQVMTKNADDFLWACDVLKDMGYTEVNLNLGCPSGTVTAKGKGSGFLAHPNELAAFFDEVFSKNPLPVSVKTRLGYETPEEFAALLDLYNRYPIACLTVHPRVRKEKYRGPVHLDVFADALANSRNPVCYNGDLRTVGEVRALEGRFPEVTHVMIGRGLVADPALARKLRGGKGTDRKELTDFLAALYQGYTDFYNRYPIACLTVHPRVRKEKYRGPVHLDVFADALANSRNPVCYNGDLRTVGEVRALEGRFPEVTHVMIGRGLVADPALARKLRGGKGTDRKELTDFLAALYQGYTDFYQGQVPTAAQRMREVWFYLIHLFDDAEKLNKQLRRFRTPAEYERIQAEILASCPIRSDVQGDLI